ncbi:MAG: hypothetical protein A2297_00205 [Elusimicrobia bacterium RIFOXYB2_FULL_48_7]|nr:MAG: hypothetical protein A2297_00205 [Elusimicrobia bacterium RIFOXYB2_FULL_48_7]
MKFEHVDLNNSKPLPAQVTEILERKITEREIPVGQKLPSHRELRKIFNVSINTISEAIANLSRDGYLSSRSKYGTYVVSAQKGKHAGLRTGSAICLLVCLGGTKKITGSMQFSEFISGVEAAVKENNLHLLYKTMDDTDSELSFDNKGKNIAGLIVTGHITPKNYSVIKEAGIPFILMGDVLQDEKVDAPREGVDLICNDDTGLTYLAAKHLIGLGHREILYIANRLYQYPVSVDLLEGYKKALKEAGIGFNEKLLVETANIGYEAMKHFLEKSPGVPFSAMVCSNASRYTFESIMKAFQDKNITEPKDIVLVGSDYPAGTTHLTVVYNDQAETGRKAVEKLVERLTDPDWKPQRVVLQGKLYIDEMEKETANA